MLCLYFRGFLDLWLCLLNSRSDSLLFYTVLWNACIFGGNGRELLLDLFRRGSDGFCHRWSHDDVSTVVYRTDRQIIVVISG